MSTPREDTPSEFERYALLLHLGERDGRRCFYCHQPYTTDKALAKRATLDHYIPYRFWRTWTTRNLVLACARCNSGKADLLTWPLVWLLQAHFPQQWAEAEAAYVPPPPKPPRKPRLRSCSRELRFYLLERDGWLCHLCRQPFDNVRDATPYRYVPRAFWASNLPVNYAAACRDCNTSRGELLPWPLVWALLAALPGARWLSQDDLEVAA
jgi:5-methylcytosine-specific restriction endonuclease McrA